MGVRVKQWKGAWWIFVNFKGRRRAKRCASRKAAELARDKIDAMLKLGQAEILDSPPPSPPPAPEYPRLRDALPEWIDRKERSGDLRGATPKAYTGRLATWAYPFQLPDGRLLGELPVDQVTREMIGAVIFRVKEAGRSLAVIEQIRNPLRGYFAELIETKTLPGPNPAADLKFFVGKRAYKKRFQPLAFFTPEEGPQLVGTARAMFPRWFPFILTGLITGLRWGESAALHKTDIDWRRGRIHVQRTFSEKGNSIQPCKDGEDRWVKASPALLTALREHVGAMELEGQVKGWTPEQRQLVFPTTHGRIVRYSYFLESVWQPLLAKAGLPYRKYHRHPAHLRHVAPGGGDGPAVGPAPARAREHRTDRRHLRPRPAGAPRGRRGGFGPLLECVEESDEGAGVTHHQTQPPRNQFAYRFATSRF